MESYMIWRLSMCVGFLLAIMVVLLIVAIFGMNWLLMKHLKLDLEEIVAQCEKCEEVAADEREN